MELMVAVIAIVCLIVLIAWFCSLYFKESPRWWPVLEVLTWLAVLVPLLLWVAIGFFVSVPRFEWSLLFSPASTAWDAIAAVTFGGLTA